ncbi:LCCL domain-containing protein [Lindgomyces ingoldianus]|uniref:LCCL domain-containing protein n=1 Tax=Lindgomyces ingoldianus TaxID=673940 RepID=A0ACB6QP34_9PLEO|nr:LCCL domain-containing protein [Lindgomyces ingoldianus]KAF2467857.1 LCCL domain-containing protein [Lindgomyces ingoldianus]
MGPSDDLDDEGAPPHVYRDDDSASVFSYHSNHSAISDTVLIHGSEASDEEYYIPQEPYHVKKYIPPRFQRAWRATKKWVKGPQPPRPWRIHPFFPRVQTAPIQFLHNYFPKRKHKVFLLMFFYVCWLLSFGLVLHRSAFAADIPGHGPPVRISCTDRFWSDGNGCGLNGDLCRPFENSTVTFRCPANCRRVQLLNPHPVGDQEVNYRPLVVGGPTDEPETLEHTFYRADSFICGAAIHAGFISDETGGCGVVSLVGERSNFPSVNRKHITSIAFDSYFPKSFSFLSGTASKCRDLRWPLLGVSLTFTILMSLFTTSPAVFFPSVFLGIFFHVALASDPPNLTDYYAIVSVALGRLLPASFCMFVVYQYCVRRQLQGLHAQIEKTILWLGGCWVGALNNYTFDKIPIERLTPHDIKQQPGAVPALIIIVLTLFSIALGQAWAIRIEGRLPRYLAVYGLFVGVLLSLVAVPKMHVRIHHYILGLLLVPGTAMQNRPSLLFQGILIGLFINGIARWGFDSILQTPGELRGDAPQGSSLPAIFRPVIHNNFGGLLTPNITFEWPLPHLERYDGMSVLVNDVERFRGYEDRGMNSFTWLRHEVDMPEYFRFAFMNGSSRGDYTTAGVWRTDGGWTEMGSGHS